TFAPQIRQPPKAPTPAPQTFAPQIRQPPKAPTPTPQEDQLFGPPTIPGMGSSITLRRRDESQPSTTLRTSQSFTPQQRPLQRSSTGLSTFMPQLRTPPPQPSNTNDQSSNVTPLFPSIAKQTTPPPQSTAQSFAPSQRPFNQ